MQNIPTKKSIIISIFLLLAFYNLKFYLFTDKDLEPSRYDWEQVQYIDSIKPVNVLLATKTLLTLVAPSNFNPTATPTYLLPNKHQKYFFRYEYRTKHKDTIVFYDVHWLNGIPKNIAKIKQIKWLNLPLKSPGEISAVTIGNANICRGNAEYLRRFLNDRNHFNFLGQEKDVYNFAYLGASKIDNKIILNYAKDAPQAQFYILFLDPFDKETGNLDIDNLLEINQVLKRKNPKIIFWIFSDTLTNSLHRLKDSTTTLIDYHFDNKNMMIPKETYENIANKISNQINE